jgi:hypothetical protein
MVECDVTSGDNESPQRTIYEIELQVISVL